MKIFSRKSIRKKEKDYTEPGYYFVTICTKDRVLSFGEIKNGTLHLSDIGNIAEKCITEIPNHYPWVDIDMFMVMPNHVHFIVHITDSESSIMASMGNMDIETVGAEDFPPLRQNTSRRGNDTRFAIRSRSLGAIIRGYKIGVTKHFRKKYPKIDLWQRNYHERIIRDHEELERIRLYIKNNPAFWDQDALFANARELP